MPRPAIIDLGSNSIRLIVYDGPGRVSLPLLNEKLICGLGRDLDRTGRLSPSGIAAARANLPRFAALARAMGADLDILATAATRIATDGSDFLRETRRLTGVTPRQLDGAGEARLSAMGVLSGHPGDHGDETGGGGLEGVVADLGGGSLELTWLAGGRPGPAASLPLGSLRLSGAGETMDRLIDDHLRQVPWLARAAGPLHVVGGAWRNLARAHMIQTGYPMLGADHYTIPAAAARRFSRLVAGLSGTAPLAGVSRRRQGIMPAAARVLERLLAYLCPPHMTVSSLGLREGYLFDRLDVASRRLDPLLATCRRLAASDPRFALDEEATVAFLRPLFPEEQPADTRRRRAATILSGTRWFENADRRAENMFFRVLRAPFVGATHTDRCMIALALFVRHGGQAGRKPVRKMLRGILTAEQKYHAWRTGLGLQLAFTLTGGLTSLLRDASLEAAGDAWRLKLTGPAAALEGSIVQPRLAALAASRSRQAGLFDA